MTHTIVPRRERDELTAGLRETVRGLLIDRLTPGEKAAMADAIVKHYNSENALEEDALDRIILDIICDTPTREDQWLLVRGNWSVDATGDPTPPAIVPIVARPTPHGGSQF